MKSIYLIFILSCINQLSLCDAPTQLEYEPFVDDYTVGGATLRVGNGDDAIELKGNC